MNPGFEPINGYCTTAHCTAALLHYLSAGLGQTGVLTQGFRSIGPLPGEALVLSAEVTEAGRLAKDRLPQL